jgi:tetratricopeptide (TPR) repeat protein
MSCNIGLALTKVTNIAPNIDVLLLILEEASGLELWRTCAATSDPNGDVWFDDRVLIAPDVLIIRIVAAVAPSADALQYIGESVVAIQDAVANFKGESMELTVHLGETAAAPKVTFSLHPLTAEAASGALVPAGGGQVTVAAIQPINVVRGESNVVLDELNAVQGFALVEAANRRLGAGLHKCNDWGVVKDTYFEAGARLAQAGLHKEAGTSFQHAAGICRFLGTEYEVANAVGYAVDSCRFVDPLQTISMLREQSETYIKCDLFLQAAKCEKDSAEIQENLGNNEEALHHYERAVALYAKDARSDSAKRLCEAKVRHLMCVSGRFTEAATMFEDFSEKHLPGIPPTTALLFAVLAHLAAASGDRYAVGVPRAQRKFGEFQSRDDNLRKGKEYELMTSIFTAFDKLSLSLFDSAVLKYRSAAHPEALSTCDVLALKCRDNLYQVLLPYLS